MFETLAEAIAKKEALDMEFERFRMKVRGVPWNPEFSYEEGRKAENYEIKWFKTWKAIEELEAKIAAMKKAGAGEKRFTEDTPLCSTGHGYVIYDPEVAEWNRLNGKKGFLGF